MAEERQEIWTYIGQRVFEKRGGVPVLGHFWRDANGQERVFKRNIVPFARPGGQFRVTWDGEKSVYVNGERAPKYVGVHEDAAEVAAWRAAEQADLALRRMMKMARNDMKEDQLRELLAPLAREYQRRDYTGRTALIATVIRYMTTGA
jgi:hypothetical protein